MVGFFTEKNVNAQKEGMHPPLAQKIAKVWDFKQKGRSSINKIIWQAFFTSMSMEVLASCKKSEIRPDLGCTTFKTSRNVVLDNPTVCVCLSVYLAVAFLANSHERKG